MAGDCEGMFGQPPHKLANTNPNPDGRTLSASFQVEELRSSFALRIVLILDLDPCALVEVGRVVPVLKLGDDAAANLIALEQVIFYRRENAPQFV